MKSISVIGLLLLAVAGLLFYLTTDFAIEKFTLSHIMGIMAGIGIGLIIGGMVGYASKGSAMRAEQKRREIQQLRKEKEDLERQAAILAKNQEGAQIIRNPEQPETKKPQRFF